MTRLDAIVQATRDEVDAQARAAAGRPRARGRAGRGPAVPRGARTPGHVADRRAQAPLAVRGRDPRGRVGHGDRARVRARRRGGALDPHRGAALRRLARRPERGARGQRTADPAQGLLRRPVPARRGDRGRRRGPARRWLAAHATSSSGCNRKRRRSTSTRSSRSTTSEELEAALEIDADLIGINNRDLQDFTVDISKTFELLADVPAGKTVVSESGIATASRSRSSSAWGSTRCSWARR